MNENIYLLIQVVQLRVSCLSTTLCIKDIFLRKYNYIDFNDSSQQLSMIRVESSFYFNLLEIHG